MKYDVMVYNSESAMTTQYGYLTYIGKSDRKSNDGRYMHELKCICGFVVFRSMNNLKEGLRRGANQSCGCMSGIANKTHGMKGTRVYSIWAGLKGRAKNINSKDYNRGYGTRGIDERWDSFCNFYEDMGDPPSDHHQIDRVDNTIGYSKSNCRWATVSENSRNRSNSHIWICDGIEFESIGDAAKHLGHAAPVVHRWFKGHMNRGKWIGPRDGFTFRKKYDDFQK